MSGHAHTHTLTHKVNFMNIHGCISYALLQWTAGKHLARMLMKQTLSLSSTAHYTVSLSLSLSALSINPAHPASPSVLSPLPLFLHKLPLSTTLSLALSFSLSFISVLPLPPPHCLLSPEDTDPYGMLWWSFPSRSDTFYLHDLVVS